MKTELGNTQSQRKGQMLFALILYRLAQGPVDIEHFTSLLQQIAKDRIKNTHIDSGVLTGSLTQVDLAKLVKKKRFKRKSEVLRSAYQQYIDETNIHPDNTGLTVEDVVNYWADLTGQDKTEFKLKIYPQIGALVIKTKNASNSGIKQDPENDQTEAAFKFMEDLLLILLEATPPAKQEALVTQMQNVIFSNNLNSDIGDLPDEVFGLGSRLLISDVITKMDKAFSVNPATKELLLQPLFGALIEMEAKKYGWGSGVPVDNNAKLKAELKEKGLFFNQRTTSRGLRVLTRRNILLNINIALDGTLMNDLAKIILEQRTDQQTRTQSEWVCEPISPEAEAEAENKILELLFKRRNENGKPD